MKIGFVLECTLDGPEMQICRWLAKQICPSFDEKDGGQFRTMVNKRFLMEGCGDEVRMLLDHGCQHVFVLWDLRPAWPNGDPSDCVRETAIVKSQLRAAKVPKNKATCVCITQELEVWLLADAEALRRFCSTDAHQQKPIPNQGRVERIDWPKKQVEKLLRDRTKRYAPHYDAIKIIRDADPNKLRKVQSYARLEDKLRALC